MRSLQLLDAFLLERSRALTTYFDPPCSCTVVFRWTDYAAIPTQIATGSAPDDSCMPSASLIMQPVILIQRLYIMYDCNHRLRVALFVALLLGMIAENVVVSPLVVRLKRTNLPYIACRRRELTIRCHSDQVAVHIRMHPSQSRRYTSTYILDTNSRV